MVPERIEHRLSFFAEQNGEKPGVSDIPSGRPLQDLTFVLFSDTFMIDMN